MATVLYVTSDRPGTGKTALCIALVRRMLDHGKKAVAFKPVAVVSNGVVTDADDYEKLVGRAAGDWPLDLPSEGLSDSLVKQIVATAEKAGDGAEVVIVEGSSDLSHEDAVRLVEALDAVVLSVIGYRRDLSAEELVPWRERHGDRLIGFVINGLTKYMGTELGEGLLPDLESQSLPVFGVIPEDRRLLGVSVAQLAEHLNGTFVADIEDTDGLVEYAMVGGMGMDPGAVHFGLRENKAVIVRGDRPDIQMAALAASSACLVLTKGIPPIEYVKYEAEQEEVPVMTVPTDTLVTMDAVAGLIDRARFDHQLKVERFQQLLEQHVDLAALYDSLGLSN